MELTNMAKYRYFRSVWIFITLLGISLLVYMIKVESEPGLIPLVLLLVGLTGIIYNHRQILKLNKESTP